MAGLTMRVVLGYLILSAGLIFSTVTNAATLPAGFGETRIAAGITSPTSMAIARDGRIFVTEQTGRLRVIKNGVLLPEPFVTLSVLLGIYVNVNFLWFTLFVGVNLFQSAFTNWCPVMVILRKGGLPDATHSGTLGTNPR